MRRSNRVKVKKQPSLDGMGYDGSTSLPNVRQELFCQLYASNSTPRFFGNGVQCYIFAYAYEEKLGQLKIDLIGAPNTTLKKLKNSIPTKYEAIKKKILSIQNTCRAEASRLLTEPNILARCNFLMDQLISDKVVDRELAYVIQQRDDLSSKTSAITHYDKKRGRLIERREDTVKFEPITGVEFIMPTKK